MLTSVTILESVVAVGVNLSMNLGCEEQEAKVNVTGTYRHLAADYFPFDESDTTDDNGKELFNRLE